MAELDELCKFLNLNPSDSIEDIKVAFNKEFVAADPKAIKANEELYSSLLGELNGTFLSKIKATAKSIGVELSKDEIEGKKTVEVLELLESKASELVGGHRSQLEELEKAVKTAQKSGASAKDIEALQSEVEIWKKKHEEVDGLLQTTVSEYDNFKGSVAQKENEYVINSYKTKAIDSVRLATKSDYERKGFLLDVEKKYRLERDGNDVIVRDAEGNQIKHPDKAGKFMDFSEVLAFEAKKANLLSDNPHDGKVITKPVVQTIPNTDPTKPVRQVAKSVYSR